MSKILIIGDIMLDNYVFGKVNLISPEAPVPILNFLKNSAKLGGAANVALNCKKLGMDVTICGGIGSDENGKKLTKLIKSHKIKKIIVEDKNYKTITKTRFLHNFSQLLRVDEEIKKFQNNKIKIINRLAKKFNTIVISDYGKGFLNSLGKNFIKNISKKKKIFVDPKGDDYSKYTGSFLVKPNQKEFFKATIKFKDKHERTLAQTLCQKFNFKNLLITKGDKGMFLYKKNSKKIFKVKSKNNEVYDVTGAGDTVLASLVYFNSLGYNLEDSIRIAREAAEVSITKIGNYQIDRFDLFTQKIIKINHTKGLSESLKKKNKKIVFTNGVFDILHAGHVDYLKKAKDLGDVLLVAINDDQSVKKIKGPNRPINTIENRLKVLSSISFIDYIVVFKDRTPLKLIKNIKPNIIVKGSDYKLSEIIGAKEVIKNKGKVKTIPIKYNLSSTSIFKKYEKI